MCGPLGWEWGPVPVGKGNVQPARWSWGAGLSAAAPGEERAVRGGGRSSGGGVRSCCDDCVGFVRASSADEWDSGQA